MKTYVVTIIKDINFGGVEPLSVPHEYEFESQNEAWALYNQAKNQGFYCMVSVRGTPVDTALRRRM